MNSGWVKIHRKLLDDDLWKGEVFTEGQAYLYLIIKANYQNSEKTIDDGKKIVIKKGQIFTSQKKLADIFSWDRTKMHRYLKKMQKLGKIDVKTEYKKYTIITLLNYEKYQEEDNKKKPEKKLKQLRKEQPAKLNFT